MGATHTGDLNAANDELNKLNQLHDTLEKQKDSYKSKEVAIQAKTGEAWILFQSGKKTEALNIMKLAADMEDSTGKHPVTPGEVLPARELLGDMLLQSEKNEDALQAYEAVLMKCPNRFNSLYQAGVAAEKTGNKEKAVFYYKNLSAIADSTNSEKTELPAVRSFLMNYPHSK